MKKLLLLILIFMVSLGVWGNGQGDGEELELDNVINSDFLKVKQLDIRVTSGLPFLLFNGIYGRENVADNFESYSNGIIVIERSQHDDLYLDSRGRKINLSAEDKQNISYYSSLSNKEWIEEVEYPQEYKKLGTVTCMDTLQRVISTYEDEHKIEYFNSPSSHYSTVVPLPLVEDRGNIYLLLINNNNSKILTLKIDRDLAVEYYPWEDGKDFNKEAYLASLLYQTEEREEAGHQGSNAFLTQFDTEISPDLTSMDLSELKYFLSRSFIINTRNESFENGHFPIPVFTGSNISYLALYEGLQSEYSRYYLEFLNNECHPLYIKYYLSRDDSLENVSYRKIEYSNDNPLGLYQRLTNPETEIDFFLVNVFRYLNWGVEYNLPATFSDYSAGATERKVYHMLERDDDSNPLWLNTESNDDRYRENVYLSSDIEAFNEGNVITPHFGFTSFQAYEFESGLDKDSTLQWAVESSAMNHIKLSRIEVWTAKNLAWEEGCTITVDQSEEVTLNDGELDGISLEEEKHTINISMDSSHSVQSIVFHSDMSNFIKDNKIENLQISINLYDNSGNPIAIPKSLYFSGEPDDSGNKVNMNNIRTSTSDNWDRITNLNGDNNIMNKASYYYIYLGEEIEDVESVKITFEQSSQIDPETNEKSLLPMMLNEVYVFDGDCLGYVYRETNYKSNLLENGVDIKTSDLNGIVKSLLFSNEEEHILNELHVLENEETREIYSLIDIPQDKLDSDAQDSIIEAYNVNGTKTSIDIKKDEINKREGLFLFPMKFHLGVGNDIDPGNIETIVFRYDPIPISGTIIQNNDLNLNRFVDNLAMDIFIDKIDTPFFTTAPYNNQRTAYQGNPIPYTVMGVDSPRTFLYKMNQQVITDDYNDTTFARNWLFGFYNKNNPRPGNMISTRSGYDKRDHHPEKSAGVDSIGLLLNSLSAQNLELRTIREENVLSKVNEYNQDLSKITEIDYFSDDHRITAGDLEIISTLVPSLEEIREGDLLVKYADDYSIEQIGIVIEIEKDETGADSLVKSISAITINRERRHAYMGEWHSDTSIYSYDSDWQEFIARRLLFQDTGDPNLNTSWDVIENVPVEMEMTIAWNPRKKIEHWVSNIPSVYNKLGKIDFNLYSSVDNNGKTKWIPQVDGNQRGNTLKFEILPLPLIDPYADKDKRQSGNIYKNTADGSGFILYVKDENDGYIDVCTYNYVAGEDQYVPILGDGKLYLSEASGHGESDYYLCWEENGKRYNDFYVNANEGSRPGDDFLMDFKLKDYENCTLAPEDNDLNFLAVYDHKMLWRANLYIDEANDWNDEHPWNADPVNGNEWNRTFNSGVTDTLLESGNISSLDRGDGGQVIEYPFYTNMYDTLITNSVAYDYPAVGFADVAVDYNATDSPFDFSYKVYETRENLKEYYDFYRFSAEDKAENINILLEPDRLRNENDLTLQASELINYEKTTAPNDYWLNYSFQDLIIPECVDYLVPYMPGLGYFRHYTVDLNPEQAIDYYTFFPKKTSAAPSHILSAGTDCIGFAQRAAGYDSGRSYNWLKMSKNITEGGSDSRSNTTYPYLENANNYSVMIAAKDNEKNVTDPVTKVTTYANLELVKPGDIVFYGEKGDAAFNGTYQPAHQGAHIMIVQDVTYHEDGSVTPDGISLIESVYIANICYVTKSRTLNHNKIIDRTWFIVRLECN